jgi:hypothetical protein
MYVLACFSEMFLFITALRVLPQLSISFLPFFATDSVMFNFGGVIASPLTDSIVRGVLLKI